MDISLLDAFHLFASDIMCDVCAHFLRNVYFIETEYVKQRSVLYSEYGQTTLIQSLDELPLEFYIELQQYALTELIDEEIFSKIIFDLKEKIYWKAGEHAKFYETCGKIITLGIVAMEYGFISEIEIRDEIVNMAQNAYSSTILDEHYDTIRKKAQSMIYTIFKDQGSDINEFVTQAEIKIGYEEFPFPRDILNFVSSLGLYTNKLLGSFVNFRNMDRSEFDSILKDAVSTFKANSSGSNSRRHFYFLCTQVGFTSQYCARNSFKEGVQHGFDIIVEIMLTEKRAALSLVKKRNLGETVI